VWHRGTGARSRRSETITIDPVISRRTQSCSATTKESSMRSEIAPIIAALIGANFLVSAPAVMAQSETPQPQQVAPSTTISDQKLDQAAAAIQQVNDVQRDYQQKLDSTAPADRPRVASEGNAALTKAVTDHGLSVEEFNSIMTVAQNDPTVRAKLLQRLHNPQQ
jgi:hypothetical protein